jgi:2TM domain
MSDYTDKTEDYTGMTENQARARAIASLKKKADFRNHLLTYLMVNTMLVVIWFMTGASFFWPIIPILGWGIGVVFHAQDVYGGNQISEADIRREMEQMK